MTSSKNLQLANQYFERGEALQKQAKFKEAIGQFEEASILYKKEDNWERWIQSNNKIGITHCFLGEYNEAMRFMKEKISLTAKLIGNNHKYRARELSSIGICYKYSGDYDRAIECHEQALALSKESWGEYHFDVGISLNNLGNCYAAKGSYNDAIQHFKQASIIWKQEADEEYLANSLNNLGSCYNILGDYDNAIVHIQEALTIWKKTLGNEHPYIALSLANIGNSFTDKGDLDKAIDYHKEALAIRLKILGIDHPDTAGSLNNIGLCYSLKGNHDDAIQYHQKALDARKRGLGEKHTEVALSMSNLGSSHFAKNNYDKALEYHQQALAILTKNLGKNHPYIAKVLDNIGICHIKKEEYLSAFSYFQQALLIFVPSFKESFVYRNPLINEYTDTYGFLETLQHKANAFFHCYQSNHVISDLQAALATIHLATDLVTDIRRSYKMEQSKLTLAQKSSKLYNQAISIALTTAKHYQQNSETPPYEFSNTVPNTPKGAKELAFAYTEQSKSILLLSTFKDSEAKTAANIPSKLLLQEKQLKVELNNLDKNIAYQETKASPKDDIILSELHSQYFNYKRQYDQLIKQFEQDYPAYYQLKYNLQMATAAQIQAHLQQINEKNEHPNTALISYFVGEKVIYIFTITHSVFEVQEIPKPSHFNNLIEDLQSALQLIDLDDFIETARALYQLLIAPIEGHTEALQKLIILRHDILEYLPFEVLLTKDLSPTSNPVYTDLPYLLQDFEICYHYSATLLLNGISKSKITQSLPNTFLGFAPVTFNGKKNIELALESKRGKNKVLRSNRRGEEALQQLPNTETEIKEVYQLFQDKKLDAKAFLYGSASKKNLIEQSSKHKFILISTHGFVEDEEAGLSGICLANIETKPRSSPKYSQKEVGNEDLKTNTRTQLSTQTPNSNTEKNYLLYTSDAYHLQLNADLVVLSSCSSGIGKLQKGEGMMAMNRGFLYAGASNIVFTQFDIPDQSSSLLIKKMFEYILENIPYSAALQRAKLEMIRMEGNNPQDWAGFVLIGG